MPFHDNTEIWKLNVMPAEVFDIPHTIDPEWIIEVEEKIRERRVAESKRILEEAKVLLEKRFGNIDVASGVENLSGKILKTARTLKANIIAVGCRGLRGINRVDVKHIKKHTEVFRMLRFDRQNVYGLSIMHHCCFNDRFLYC